MKKFEPFTHNKTTLNNLSYIESFTNETIQNVTTGFLYHSSMSLSSNLISKLTYYPILELKMPVKSKLNIWTSFIPACSSVVYPTFAITFWTGSYFESQIGSASHNYNYRCNPLYILCKLNELTLYPSVLLSSFFVYE